MTSEKNITNKKNKKIELWLTILKLALLMMILVAIPLYIYFFHKDFLDNFKSLDALNIFLERYKTTSIFVYLVLQVIQIVICIIPGQAIQFASGYAYGFWLGYILSILGVAIGTTVTFYLSRILGKESIHVLFGKKKLVQQLDHLNSKKAFLITFVIFLIPGLPKDLLTYAAGISQMKLKQFLLLSLIGRTPSMMGSIVMGSMVNNGSYFGVIVLAIFAVVLCILGLVYKNKVMRLVDKLYSKLERL